MSRGGWPDMHAGRLTARLRVERLAVTSDGMGGSDGAWIGQGEIWAAIEPTRSAERVEAAQQRGTALYRVTVRNGGLGAAVTAADRLVWLSPQGDVTLNVRGAPVLAPGVAWRMLEAESGVAT